MSIPYPPETPHRSNADLDMLQSGCRSASPRQYYLAEGGTIALIKIDFSGRRDDSKMESDTGIRHGRNHNFRLVKGGNETRIAIRAVNSERSTVGLEEGSGIGCRR